MMADVCAAVMLFAFVVYGLSGGADFGAGIWHLFAAGPRAGDQRAVIDEAIAPIWEANHVWLILVVVLLFVCFPVAFSVASIALHIPLTLMLFGIVIRGAGFAFRHYAATSGMRRRWSRAFAIASAFTPFFLGVCVGAISADRIVLLDGVPAAGFVGSWLHPFALSVGGFALSLFAFLAAVYLLNETNDAGLQDDFRRRAFAAAVAVGAFALLAAVAAQAEALQFARSLVGSWWSWPLQIVTGIMAIGVFASLIWRKYAVLRVFAIAQVALILLGWGMAQHPMMIRPALTIDAAAASPHVIRLILGVLLLGSVLLGPAFFYLYGVFKGVRL
jgi:cytochrome d ubiquinol oxidase subunit II